MNQLMVIINRILDHQKAITEFNDWFRTRRACFCEPEYATTASITPQNVKWLIPIGKLGQWGGGCTTLIIDEREFDVYPHLLPIWKNGVAVAAERCQMKLRELEQALESKEHEIEEKQRKFDVAHRCLFPPIDGGALFLPPHFSGPWGGTRPPIFRDPGGEIFVCPPKKMGGHKISQT